MKRCIYCGNENDDSASACAFCGNPLPNIPDGHEKRYTGFSGNPDDDALLSAQGGQALFGLDHQEVPAEGRESGLLGNERQSALNDSAAFLREEQAEGPAQQGYEFLSDPAPQKGEEVSDFAQKMGDDRLEGFSPSSVVTFPAGGTGAVQEAQSRDGMRQSAAPDQISRRKELSPENQGGNAYRQKDPAQGYDRNWQQDVGRGQTYAAREQVAKPGRNDRVQDPRDPYGNNGYGYRQVQGGSGRDRGDYGRSGQSTNGNRAFIVRARKMVRSFFFVMLALFYSLMVGFNMYNILSGNALFNLSQADTMLAGILGGGENSFAVQMLSEFAKQLVSMIVNVNAIVAQLGGTVKILILLVFLIPNVLLALAFWLMFAQTTTRKKQFPMGGYLLARVMMVLKFIVACLVLIVGLVISVYFVVVGASSAQFSSSFIEGIFMLAVMVVASVLTVMFYLQWIFVLKVVTLNTRNGRIPGKVPTYLIVISFLGAVLSVLLMIPMSPDDYFGLLARGSAAGSFLFSWLWLMVYRIKVKRTA